MTVRLVVSQEEISLSEGSTVDLRRPGDEIDDFSELADESMEPDECFPDCKYKVINMFYLFIYFSCDIICAAFAFTSPPSVHEVLSLL